MVQGQSFLASGAARTRTRAVAACRMLREQTCRFKSIERTRPKNSFHDGMSFRRDAHWRKALAREPVNGLPVTGCVTTGSKTARSVRFYYQGDVYFSRVHPTRELAETEANERRGELLAEGWTERPAMPE